MTIRLWIQEHIITPEPERERGKKMLRFTRAGLLSMSASCAQCVPRCKTFFLFLSSQCNYTPFSSFHGAGVSISPESLFFHLQMLVLMDSFHHRQSSPASCSIPPLTGRLKPRMSYILPYLNLHCPPCLLPGRDMKYWLFSSGPAAPSLH